MIEIKNDENSNFQRMKQFKNQFQIQKQQLTCQKMIFMQSLERNKEQSLKHRMFYLHHQILKHYSLSNTLYGIFLFFEMLQMIYYAIHSTYPDLWPLGITSVIQKVLHFIEFSGVWEVIGEAGLIVFLVIMFLMYVVNLCFILYEILKKEYKTKEPNMIAYKYISFVGILTKTILFIPTVYACTSFIMANSQHFPMTISSSLFGAIAALSVPTLILLFINTINFNIFLRENNPFSPLPFVCSVTQNEQIRTLIKLLMGFYGALIHEQSSIGKVFCIILFMVNAFYISKIYHSPRTLKSPYAILLQLAPCLTIWICLQSLLQQFIYTGETIGILFLGCGIVIIPFVWVELKQRFRAEIMYSNYKFITSPQELLYYNYECLNCVNNLHDVRNLIYLEGILNYHISQCKKAVETCVCFKIREQMSNYKLEGEKGEIAQQKQLWFRFIKQNLTEIKEKYRNIPEISMLLAYIERDQLNNKFKALHNLEEPSHFNSGLKIEFLNYHYLRQIEERMFNEDKMANEKKTVDVNKFFDFQTNFGKLEKGIEESTVSHLTFWSNLSSELASKKKLISDGKLIADKVQETRKLYQKLIEINPSNLHCLIIYANYMKIIVNNPEVYEKSNEAIKVIKRNILNSSKLNNDPEKEKYGDNAVTGVIIISGERSNIGVIKHCNTKITELIKYSPHELLGQNVNILMPKFIGSMHDDILMSYLELTESKHDNNERLAPMIDKDNYLVFVRILTKPLPSLFNGLEMVGIFNLVMESHIDHSGEIPKYVLYRTDSGQVQALSESCDAEFNYRINKIDENHETSSELTFNSLFAGVKDSQLSIVDKSVKSKVKVASEDNEHNEINVQVYLRHQIYYFGVKLKLLYFFTLKSFKNMGQNDMDPQQNGVYKKIMVQQEEAEGMKQNEGEKSNELAKEKKIRELMRKKNNSAYEPISLKILSRLGYLAHLALIAVIIFLLVTDLSKNSYLKDFLTFSRISLLSEAQLVEINHFSRMKHLSYFYPNKLNEFDLYSDNITTLSSQLQKNQFSLVQYALQAKDNKLTYNKYPLSWTINQNSEISSSTTTLDVNVFDYITGSSHFESSQQSALSFPLKLMSQPKNSSEYIELFHLRYTGLFQTIPNKNTYYESSNDYFNSLQSSTLSTNSVQLGAIIAVIMCMLFFYIPLLVCLDKFINQTVMLFGHMNPFEIDKEVTNCKVFLEIFFKDSYSVKLTFKKKNSQISSNAAFSVNDLNVSKPKSPHQGVFGSFKPPGENEYQNEAQKPRRGSILQSTQKIEALEQQFHNRTQHEIDLSNQGLVPNSQFEEQRQEMLAKANYEQDESIYEKLQKTKDNSKFKYIFVFLFISSIFVGYFIVRYFVNIGAITQNHEDIANLKMVSESLNLMKKVKLYGLESVIDNSNFKNYSLLTDMLSGHVSDLYEHQRNYNTYIYPASANLAVIFGNDKISSLIKESLCAQDNMDLYLSSAGAMNMNVFPKVSYSSKECELLEDGILKQGLRPALIAFTEILANFTSSPHSVDQMVQSDKFDSVIKMQKYLEGVQLFYIQKLETNINTQLQSFKKVELLICIVMIFIIVFMIFIIWWPMMNNLYGKIVSSSQILGLIPLRIFIKNSKLAKQYEKFISQMIE